MIPLSVADEGEVYTVRRLGGNPEVKQHLADMGFAVGSNVAVLSKTGGNVIVKVKETRVAISEELSRKIMV